MELDTQKIDEATAPDSWRQAWQWWTHCSDATHLLQFLATQGSERKLRLFAVACCRLLGMADERARHALEVVEQFADGIAGADELALAREGMLLLISELGERCDINSLYYNCAPTMEVDAANAITAAASIPLDLPRVISDSVSSHVAVAWCFQLNSEDRKKKALFECDLVEVAREIFGMPSPRHSFKMEPAWLSWNGGAVSTLAQEIYDERRFTDLPRLADLLKEAGCDTSNEVLNHCRYGNGHLRGCWALDMILGKT